jgi:hypothetical protein
MDMRCEGDPWRQGRHRVGALRCRDALAMTEIACGLAPAIAPDLCNAAHAHVRNPGLA